jgi:hypothetical protein
MLVAAVAAAALLAIIVALLAVPAVLVIDAERGDTLEARWRVRWLFGLVDVRWPRARPAFRSPDRSETPRTARAPGSKRGKGARMGIAVLRTRGLLRQVRRLTSTLLQKVKLQEFHLHTAFGFDDPADTGVVFGLLSPALVMARLRGLDVDCRPMFLQSGLRGVFSVTVRVRPLLVAGALVPFLVSPPVFRAARSAWRARR